MVECIEPEVAIKPFKINGLSEFWTWNWGCGGRRFKSGHSDHIFSIKSVACIDFI